MDPDRAEGDSVASGKSDSFIRSRLKARQMALLVHLDEHRSVMKAAEACGMTQPAASKLLREFEEAFDVKLFERHARGVVPTWFGEILVRRARAVLSEIGLAQEEIAALKGGFAGQTAIGTVLSPGTNLVPMAIELAKRRRPGLSISVALDYSKPLVKRLLQGDLDMVIGRILESHGADELAFEPLGNEQHAVVAAADHPLAGQRGLALGDFVDQGWILPEPGSVLRDRLVGAFVEQGLRLPSDVVETTSLPVITSLLRRTNMVAALPIDVVQPYCQAGVLTVLIPNLNVQIGVFGLVTHRHRKLSPGAQVLLTSVRESAARLYSSPSAPPRLIRMPQTVRAEPAARK
jgi:DNA-binding transcriptional LysR family regulator